MHLEDCISCENLNRAEAYERLGLAHFIPATHGAGWIGEDLRRMLRFMGPGFRTRLHYGPVDDPRPHVTLIFNEDAVCYATVKMPDGVVREFRGTAGATGGYETIVYGVLVALKEARGTRQLVIVPRGEQTNL